MPFYRTANGELREACRKCPALRDVAEQGRMCTAYDLNTWKDIGNKMFDILARHHKACERAAEQLPVEPKFDAPRNAWKMFEFFDDYLQSLLLCDLKTAQTVLGEMEKINRAWSVPAMVKSLYARALTTEGFLCLKAVPIAA